MDRSQLAGAALPEESDQDHEERDRDQPREGARRRRWRFREPASGPGRQGAGGEFSTHDSGHPHDPRIGLSAPILHRGREHTSAS